MVAPRLGLDAAYAAPWVSRLELSQGLREEEASLDLPDVGNARVTLEAEIAPEAGGEGRGLHWSATPGVFCQFDFGYRDELYCGAALALEAGYRSASRERELRVKASGEVSSDHSAASVSLRDIWYFGEGQGQSEMFMELGADGGAEAGYEVEWRF